MVQVNKMRCENRFLFVNQFSMKMEIILTQLSHHSNTYRNPSNINFSCSKVIDSFLSIDEDVPEHYLIIPYRLYIKVFFVDETWGPWLHPSNVSTSYSHPNSSSTLFFDGQAKKFIRFVGVEFQIQDLDNHGRVLQKIAKLVLPFRFRNTSKAWGGISGETIEFNRQKENNRATWKIPSQERASYVECIVQWK